LATAVASWVACAVAPLEQRLPQRPRDAPSAPAWRRLRPRHPRQLAAALLASASRRALEVEVDMVAAAAAGGKALEP